MDIYPPTEAELAALVEFEKNRQAPIKADTNYTPERMAFSIDRAVRGETVDYAFNRTMVAALALLRAGKEAGVEKERQRIVDLLKHCAEGALLPRNGVVDPRDKTRAEIYTDVIKMILRGT